MSNNTIRRKTASLLRLLMGGSYSLYEMADKTGMDYETVRPFVNELHAAGVVHITDWRRRANVARWTALYTLGTSIDAPKPKPLNGTKRTRKYRNKLESEPLRLAPKKVVAPSSVFDLGRHMGLT